MLTIRLLLALFGIALLCVSLLDFRRFLICEARKSLTHEERRLLDPREEAWDHHGTHQLLGLIGVFVIIFAVSLPALWPYLNDPPLVGSTLTAASRHP